MIKSAQNNLVKQINSLSQNLRGAYDLDPLLHLIGDARYVLMGGASYGTSEDFLWRVRLSQRLINEKCFSFIAVEGDWSDCYRVNRYVKDYPDSGNRAYDILNNFKNWPSWVWANWQTAAFAEWLREYNSLHKNKIGFYGLDAYNLWNSLALIVPFVKKNYPEYPETVQRAYKCFEPLSENDELYTWTPGFVPGTLLDEASELLSAESVTINQQNDTDLEPELILRNSGITLDAEMYYKVLLKGGTNSWNIRDTGMAYILDSLMKYHGNASKGIIWMQNSHIGDPFASALHESGLINFGQLARERYEPEGVICIGFGIYSGEVIAADRFGESPGNLKIPNAENGSLEDIFHKSGNSNKLIILKDINESEDLLKKYPQRSIGITYNPGREKETNYLSITFPKAYDAYIYIDSSPALSPLHPEKENINPPETYPWGM